MLLGWIVIAASTFGVFTHVVFGGSVTLSFLTSLDSMFSPKARWRQLRSSSGILQSTIWMYRTRVGPFQIEGNETSTRPEAMLCQSLNEWRDLLINGAHLTLTGLKRRHADNVYRHFQNSGHPSEDGDDCQSPTKPSRYIVLRIQPMVAFINSGSLRVFGAPCFSRLPS